MCAQSRLTLRHSGLVDATDPASEEARIAWWESLTAAGGEGMVVKPREFVVRGKSFMPGESLRRVHECVFSVLESEPVEPRL